VFGKKKAPPPPPTFGGPLFGIFFCATPGKTPFGSPPPHPTKSPATTPGGGGGIAIDPFFEKITNRARPPPFCALFWPAPPPDPRPGPATPENKNRCRGLIFPASSPFETPPPLSPPPPTSWWGEKKKKKETTKTPSKYALRGFFVFVFLFGPPFCFGPCRVPPPAPPEVGFVFCAGVGCVGSKTSPPP